MMAMEQYIPIGPAAVFASLFNQFFLQLIIAEHLFAGGLQRRGGFRRRVIGFGLLGLLLSSVIFILCYFSPYWLISNTLCYLLLFALGYGYLYLCYDERADVLLLTAASGYMTQHIGAQLVQLFSYGYEPRAMSGGELLVWSLLELPVFAVVYYLIWRAFGRHSTRLEDDAGLRGSLTRLSIMTLLVVLVLSSVRDTHAGESFALMLVSRALSVVCCLLLLYLRSRIIERAADERERALLLQMNELQKRQYAQSRENIELINIKCHDLKHQIHSIRAGEADAAELSEIESLIDIYDSSLDTGNKQLDTIFAEKSVICRKHCIRLSAIVDGTAVSMLSVGDTYSLFGNALDNAIEAVRQLENNEDRIISVSVRRQGRMAVCRFENYFNGKLLSEDGELATTKGDSGYHGFGIRSMRRIAETYGGSLAIETDEMFHLTILLPME